LTIFYPAELSLFLASTSAQEPWAGNSAGAEEVHGCWRCTNAKDAFRCFDNRLDGGAGLPFGLGVIRLLLVIAVIVLLINVAIHRSSLPVSRKL
jgi:hypothetical protein